MTIALLGFALLTLLLGARAGRRIAESGHRRLGGLSGVAVFALLSAAVTLSVLHPMARPSIWQGVLLPTLVFAAGLGLGMLRADRDADAPRAERGRVARWVAGLPIDTRATAGAALRGGFAAVSIILVASAVALTALLVFGYADIIRLYEALHTEVVGGIAVTALQLAALPDLVVWTASWFVGPGFAIGTGSQVSPLGTALGPLPALPIFGALPTGDSPLAFAGLLVPVVAGFLAGAAVRPALARALEGVRLPAVLLVGLGGGVAGAGPARAARLGVRGQRGTRTSGRRRPVTARGRARRPDRTRARDRPRGGLGGGHPARKAARPSPIG